MCCFFFWRNGKWSVLKLIAFHQRKRREIWTTEKSGFWKKELEKWLLGGGKISEKNQDGTESLPIWLEMEKCHFLSFGKSHLVSGWKAELSLHTRARGFRSLSEQCVLTEPTWPLALPGHVRHTWGLFLTTSSPNFGANVIIYYLLFFQMKSAIPCLLQQRKQHRHIGGEPDSPQPREQRPADAFACPPARTYRCEHTR